MKKLGILALCLLFVISIGCGAFNDKLKDDNESPPPPPPDTSSNLCSPTNPTGKCLNANEICSKGVCIAVAPSTDAEIGEEGETTNPVAPDEGITGPVNSENNIAEDNTDDVNVEDPKQDDTQIDDQNPDEENNAILILLTANRIPDNILEALKKLAQQQEDKKDDEESE